MIMLRWATNTRQREIRITVVALHWETKDLYSSRMETASWQVFGQSVLPGGQHVEC